MTGLDIRVGLCVLTALAAAAGCAPVLKTPDGAAVSLAAYDAVRVQEVTCAPEVDRPDLARDVEMGLLEALQASEAWQVRYAPARLMAIARAQAEAIGMDPAQLPDDPEAYRVKDETGGPDDAITVLDLYVTILKVEYPSKADRLLLSRPYAMTCRLDVRDPGAELPLATADVTANRSPPGGGLLGAGLLGAALAASQDDPRADRLLLKHSMARELVKVLEQAKQP
jgi:hypothetical protein